MKIVREHLNETIPTNYYQDKFGGIYASAKKAITHPVDDKNEVVAYVSNWQKTESYAIVKNPKVFDDFHDFRAIIDYEGNIYVATIDEDFNHGLLGNALIKKGIIKCKYAYDIHTCRGGVYNNPNFILGYLSQEVFYGSDTFESFTHEMEEEDVKLMKEILKKLHRKNPKIDYTDILDAIQEGYDEIQS